MVFYTEFSPWIIGSAILGFVTVYLIIATLVGREVYKRCSGSDVDRAFSGFMAGGFFPITVPIGVVAIVCFSWIKAILSVKLEAETETSTPYYDSQIEDLRNEVERLRQDKKEDEDVKEEEVVELEKPKFRVGDLITGVSGNPNNYKVLYQGCLCRVLEINDKGLMKVILVDHTDKEAHKKRIGEYFNAPARNFILYTTETSKKAKTKKK